MAGKPTGNDALALDIRDVSFEYAEGRAGAGVYGISLQLEPGQVALLTGASGCGKTTVTRLANGLVPHYYEGTLSGRAQVAGVDVSAAPLYETARVAGSVFQNPKTQFFSVDVRGEVAFGCENLGLPVEDIEARVAAQAKAFNLEDLMGRSLFDLSGGQKQRIACAAATAASPALVVMDEPSSNLDFEGIVRLREAIRHWKAQGRAVLVAEHRLHYVADIADLVLYMERGRIARRWTGAEFAALPADALCDLGLRVRRVQDAFAAMGAASASPAAEPSEAEAPAAPTASSSEAEVQTAPAISPSESEAPAVPTAATSQASAKALAIDDFRFAYRRGANATLALDIEHAELPQGGIVAVVGRNGAGKSTFAEALCGLNRCGGRLTVGRRALGRKQRTRASFMVMQDVNHQLFAESVLDEVQLSLAEEDEAHAHELLRAARLGRYRRRPPALAFRRAAPARVRGRGACQQKALGGVRRAHEWTRSGAYAAGGGAAAAGARHGCHASRSHARSRIHRFLLLAGAGDGIGAYHGKLCAGCGGHAAPGNLFRMCASGRR